MAVTMNAVELYTYDDTLRNDERYQGYDAINATYNMYTVAGIEDGSGNLRKLSISELVMAVCLARAQEKEEAVIDTMRGLSGNTYTLEVLTDIEERLLDGQSLSSIELPDAPWRVEVGGGMIVWCYNAGQLLSAYGIDTSQSTEDVCTGIESKMDSLNSFSQENKIRRIIRKQHPLICHSFLLWCRSCSTAKN